MLRTWAISILIFIILIIGLFQTYYRHQPKHVTYRINPNYTWVGVIDMDHDHGIDITGVINGHDVLLMLDNTSPYFQQFIQQVQARHPTGATLRTSDYDSNNNGLLDVEDPMTQFFRVLVFFPERKNYELRTLAQAGIRAIRLNLQNNANNEVVLSDGSRRTIYEINQPGGTSIYKTRQGTVVRTLP